MGADVVDLGKKSNSIVLKNISCLMTLEPASQHYGLQSLTVDTLGIKNNIDVVIEDGTVTEILSNSKTKPDFEVIDCSRKVVMPALVDAHNHPIFGGNRAKETVLKAQGMTYEEIAKKGGGIAASVNPTRAATSAELTNIFCKNALNALSRGVVLLEAKTGYGLNPSEELKILQAIFDAYTLKDGVLPYCAPTYLAPHSSSPDFSSLDKYIDALVDQLPQLKALCEKNSSSMIFKTAVDIFVERNYFTYEQGEKWLSAALQLGFDVHIHADEFSESGGTRLAKELAANRNQSRNKKSQEMTISGQVLSVDHCQHATEADLVQLARLGVSGVVLPTTSFFSNIAYVDAKKFRQANVNCAIASDFNPGSSPINNIWFAAHLALTKCGFTLPEVICGVSLNAARALNAHEKFGTIEIGRPANIIVFEGTEADDFFASPLGDHLTHVLIAPNKL